MPDASTELEALFPGIPSHGDVRNVIAALEAGELVLKPDVVEMSSPCQGRSMARSLSEWSEVQRPHHDLWFLQPKLISLLQPREVLIENVPARNGGAHPTMPQYQKLRADIEQLGYQWTERNDIICSSHGDHTSRTRYFAVATRDDLPPFVFPEPTSSYKGMWHLLEPESKVRRLVRCSAHSHGFLRERWRKRSVNQFHSN